MSEQTILFIAEPQAVSAVFQDLQQAGFRAGLADSLSSAKSFIKKTQPLLIIARPQLQHFSAEELLLNFEDLPPIIILSKKADATEAEKFLNLGAYAYWNDPLLWEKMELILNAIHDINPSATELVEEKDDEEKEIVIDKPKEATTAPQFQIIGQHAAIQNVLALAKQVAKSRATVLISGESGTGKEMFARFLHFHSDRVNQPFVAINCAALPEHLLESELFGHEKGSFTGAISKKLGKFELANNGTILLDEITEMDIALQAKLLRVLQEGEFDRIGGMSSTKVDVRVIATTNRTITDAVKEGKFREDLYYRLNVIPLKLPSLKERSDDIPVLANFFVQKFCLAYNITKTDFDDSAKQWLLEYSWPGNVRELQNLIERAVLLACGNSISRKHFLMDDQTWEPEEKSSIAGTNTQAETKAPIVEAFSVMPLYEMEKRLIIKSLDETSGNRTRAAELLGISVRTLRNKLSEYKKDGINL